MRPRESIALSGLALILALTLSAVAAQSPSTQTFRVATDLVLVDVSVTDRARQPVRGLTAGDFTVLVDGEPRDVVTFRAIESPVPALPSPIVDGSAAARWTREVVPDVATNRDASGRAVAILLDDYSLAEARLDPGQIAEARRTALSIIDALGTGDRAAVLFSGNRHTAQTFTTDRGLLRAAVERAAIVPEPPDNVQGIGPGDQGFCPCGVCSLEAIERVSRTFRSLPDQRKVIAYISAGSIVVVPRSLVPPTANEVADGALRKEYCAWERYRAMDRAMRQAQLANVTINAFDPTGVHLAQHGTPSSTPKLSSGSGGGEAGGQYAVLENPAVLRTESLRAFADATGGRAVVNNNDLHLEAPAVLGESSAYYLLGVQPAANRTAGRFHPIQVRVNRPGIDVRTRAGYFDPTADEARDIEALATAGAMSSIVGPLPASGIALDVAAVAVASEDGTTEIAIATAVSPPPRDRRPLPRVETADIVAALFNPETGDLQGTHEARLELTWTENAPFGVYEVLSRMPARPGQYELRVGVTTDDGRKGSAYATVNVPPFDEALAVSGLVLSAAPAPVTGRTGDLSSLLPIDPTSRRTFSTNDAVSAFLRVYQPSGAPMPARVSARLLNAAGEVVATDALDLDGRVGGARWTADYDVVLPIDTLAAGEYLFDVTVVAGARTAERRLRFRME